MGGHKKTKVRDKNGLYTLVNRLSLVCSQVYLPHWMTKRSKIEGQSYKISGVKNQLSLLSSISIGDAAFLLNFRLGIMSKFSLM